MTLLTVLNLNWIALVKHFPGWAYISCPHSVLDLKFNFFLSRHDNQEDLLETTIGMMMDNDISMEMEIAFKNVPFKAGCKCKRKCVNENVSVVKKACDATITLAYVRIKWNRYKYILDNGLVLPF